jgi:hypothetical protein
LLTRGHIDATRGWPAASGLTLMVASRSRSTAANAVITFAVLAGGSASCS